MADAISSTTGTLNAPGIGSGLDVKGIISQLMAVEQRPLSLLTTQEASFQSKLTSLGLIKGSLSSLQSAAQALGTASDITNTASSSSVSVLGASAASDAQAGNYSVTVDQLARSQNLLAAGQSSVGADIGSGASTTLTFTFGTISSVLGPTNGVYSDASFAANAGRSVVSVTIGSTNNTLAGIRDAINATNAGVTASIINDGSGTPYRLAIASADTGAANSLSVAVSGDSAIAALLAYDPASPTQNLKQSQSAANAELTVNGVAISSASNQASGAIQGVTLTLAKTTALSGPVSVTVQRDNSGMAVALKALVAAYNDSNRVIAGATGKAASLQGDGGVLGVQRQLRAAIGARYEAAGAYSALSQLGVSFLKDGTLSLDSAKLNTALAADPAGLAALSTMVGEAMDGLVSGLLGTSSSMSSRTEGIKSSITALGERRTAMQKHLIVVQSQYQRQFSALDTLISGMNATSSFLTQQLEGLKNLYIK